jgi:hypothetical protein
MAIELGSAYGKVIIDSSGAKKGIEESKKSVTSLSDTFKSLGKEIIKAEGIAVGVGAIIVKALDFGRAGAVLAQTEESFKSFMLQIGAAPDILEQLGKAARYTIDDDELMAATMRMLTGTSGKLSQSLSENAPALMEIAKASNKLNPTLGSTISLYEAMSTSIKNLTPRGLKQAGIVVDSSAAYEKYAKSIGKTADALTEEEQAQALLNAVLEKGKTLIQQVGGNTESATDRFDRAQVAIGELKDTIQLGLMPVLGDMATGLNLILSGGKGDIEQVTEGWDNFIDRTSKGSQSALDFAGAYSQRVKAIYDSVNEGGPLAQIAGGFTILRRGEEGFTRDAGGARQAILQLATSFDEYMKAAEKAGLTTRIVRKEDQLLTEAEFNNIKAIQDLIKGVDLASMSYDEFLGWLEQATGINFEVTDSTNSLSDTIIAMATNIYNATHETQDLIDVHKRGLSSATDYNHVLRGEANTLDALSKAAANYRKEQEKLNAAEMSRVQAGISGQLGKAVENYQQGMDDLAKKRLELEGKMKELGATDFLPALDIKKIAQYQSQLTGLWVSVHDLNMKRKEGEELSDEEQATWDETMDKVGALKYKITELGGVPYLTPDQRKELEELRKQYGECDDEARQLQDALRKATNEMIFQRASADLDAKATLELGRALGVISEEDYAVATVLDGLNKATASTDPGAYAAQVKAIADAIDRLHNKDIEVTVTTIQQEIQAGGGTGGTGGTGSSGAPTNIPGGPSEYGYAKGVTNFMVPPGYPNDSFMVGLTSGEILNVLPTGQKSSPSEINISMPIIVYGDADVPTIKQAAYDGANRGTLAAMRERGMR